MAEFNPKSKQRDEVPSYTPANMRGYEGNKAGSIVGEGLTKAFSEFFRATDENIKTRIADDIARDFDALNESAGVARLPTPSEGTGLSTDPTVGPPAEVLPGTPQRERPAGIDSFQNSARIIEAGRAQGAITEAQYYNEMNTLLRQTRGKYPGYRHEVDAAFRTVTGSRGNELRDLMLANRGREDPEVARYNSFVSSNLQDIPPAMLEAIESGNSPPLIQLQKAVAERKRARINTADSNATLELESKEGRMTAEKALPLARAEARTTVSTILEDTMTKAGHSYQSIRQLAERWRELRAQGGDLNATEKGKLKAVLNSLDSISDSIVTEVLTRNRSTSGAPVAFADHLTAEQREDIKKLALAPIVNLKQALINGDVPMIAATTDMLAAMKEDAGRRILQDSPVMQEFIGMPALVGADTTALLMAASGVGDALISTFNRERLARAVKQQAPSDPADPIGQQFPSLRKDLTEAAQHPELSKAGDGMLQAWDKIAEEIAAGKVPGRVSSSLVHYFFGPDNFKQMEGMSAEGQRNLFTRVASPKVSDAIKALKDAGDEQSWNTYRNWVLNAFQAQSTANIHELSRFSMDRSKMQVVFNPQSNQYEVKLSPELEALKKQGRNEDMAVSLAFKNVTDSVAKLNSMVRVVVPVLLQEGTNPADQLGRLLSAVRYDKGSVAEGLAEGVNNRIEGPPDQRDIWEETRPFQAPFAAPGSEQGTATRENRPLPQTGTLSLGPYGQAAIHGATDHDVATINRALKTELGILAPSVSVKAGVAAPAQGPYIQLKSGARIHLPQGIDEATIQKIVPKLEKHIPGAKLAIPKPRPAERVPPEKNTYLPDHTQEFIKRRKAQGKIVPVTLRNNNPGAISITGKSSQAFVEKMPGYAGKTPRPAREGGHYAVFETPAHGVHAASLNLLDYANRRGLRTVSQIVRTWAAEPGPHYVPTVLRYLKAAGFEVEANTKLDIDNPAVRAAMIMGKSAHESGLGKPTYTEETYTRGVLGEFDNDTLSPVGAEILNRIKSGTPVKQSEFDRLMPHEKLAIIEEGLGGAA
jgi:hypothetical protein